MSASEAAENDEALAAQYVLDELPPDQRQAFEARLRLEPDLACMVQARREELARLAETLTGVEPAHDIWRTIETALEQTALAPQSSRPPVDGAAADGCSEKNC